MKTVQVPATAITAADLTETPANDLFFLALEDRLELAVLPTDLPKCGICWPGGL